MKDYDSNEENIFFVYSDVNNLYGLAMSQYLPYGGFKRLSQKELINLM